MNHFSYDMHFWTLFFKDNCLRFGVKLDIHIEKLDIENHKEMTLKSIFIHILICQN